MKKDFYKEGYNLTIANVKSLIRVSIKAAETEDFGIACSLNILAAEEALKALFLIIKHYNPEGNINNFDKIFHSHPVKHQELKKILNFQEVIQAKNKEFLKKLEPILIVINKMSDDDKLKNVEIINSLNDDYRWYKEQSQRSFNLEDILTWLNEANNDKNNGLYVGQSNQKWISPNEVPKHKFEKEKLFTESILDHVLNLEEVYMRIEKSQVFSKHFL